MAAAVVQVSCETCVPTTAPAGFSYRPFQSLLLFWYQLLCGSVFFPLQSLSLFWH